MHAHTHKRTHTLSLSLSRIYLCAYNMFTLTCRKLLVLSGFMALAIMVSSYLWFMSLARTKQVASCTFTDKKLLHMILVNSLNF